ncbi:KTSC domain-containing protein [Flavobacterium cellulosilyticum]|uniref:KTSC domain-containing protein n=1 Tax=Flavobacterium cellulosilyticum TaxID=2541731 RepID=A0A4R5CDF4_9FLAO|nr:KTSC domain-containing protein [Flavobacterium cellulosilyticum]TDD95182.1 KTSC domain-containing protein [Flavobacterium cellulosilyticum]
MNRYTVNDHNIISIGYDEIKNVLEIEFKLQAIHQYFNVSLDEFIALMKAPKKETHYFNFVYCQYLFDVV